MADGGKKEEQKEQPISQTQTVTIKKVICILLMCETFNKLSENWLVVSYWSLFIQFCVNFVCKSTNLWMKISSQCLKYQSFVDAYSKCLKHISFLTRVQMWSSSWEHLMWHRVVEFSGIKRLLITNIWTRKNQNVSYCFLDIIQFHFKFVRKNFSIYLL